MIGNLKRGLNEEAINKIITIGLNNLGVSSFEEVTYEMVASQISSLNIIKKKGENYYFKLIEFSSEPTTGFVVIDLTIPQTGLKVTDLTN